MDAARHARVKELFEAALALEPAERAAFLARRCAHDPGLEGEVAELLRHHAAAPGFLSGRAAGERTGERPMPKLAVPGYRIERELGRGGMGVVYLAEQERPRRAVALKFLRLDSLKPSDVERFEREGEILGRLRHPGIAHVYEVGLAETEQGELPWIAMEYVRGEALREHLARHAPELREQVRLFAELCDAVEHAHASGVVHRDLKPSNVLVDERGQVRVLDFGVARLVGDGVAEGGTPAAVALRTRTGQMVGTLAYASPEQAAGRSHVVDARSDVYALGVILHELLTGDLPYAIDESKVLEAIQTICDEEPRRLCKLRRDAPADLETILLKALEKEPARRYASAGELAADLRRFLAERPVRAQAPSTIYQVRKFVRRNRAVTVSTTAVILALLVTVGALLVLLRNDHRQSERRTAMLEMVARMVFQLAPELGFGQAHRATLETLDRSLAQELALVPGDPTLCSLRARSLYELGGLDQTAGDLPAAAGRYEAALDLRTGLVAEDPADLESRTHLSQLYARLGELAGLRLDPAGELAWFQRAFELDQALVREHPGDGELVEDLGWSLERMTALALHREDWAEAERYASWRLTDAVRLVAEAPDNWKYLYNAAQAHVLSSAVATRRAPDAVEGHWRELLSLARRLNELQPRRGDFQYLWATANHSLARQLFDSGRYPEALPYAESSFGLALQLRSGDPGSVRFADFLRFTFQTLFGTLHALGLVEQAEATLTRLRVGANFAGEDSPSAWFLIAEAEHQRLLRKAGTPEAPEARERVLRLYQELLLDPRTSPELFEAVATQLPGDPDLGPELWRRLLASDESVGRKLAGLLGLDPGASPGLTLGPAAEGR